MVATIGVSPWNTVTCASAAGTNSPESIRCTVPRTTPPTTVAVMVCRNVPPMYASICVVPPRTPVTVATPLVWPAAIWTNDVTAAIALLRLTRSTRVPPTAAAAPSDTVISSWRPALSRTDGGRVTVSTCRTVIVRLTGTLALPDASTARAVSVI